MGNSTTLPNCVEMSHSVVRVDYVTSGFPSKTKGNTLKFTIIKYCGSTHVYIPRMQELIGRNGCVHIWIQVNAKSIEIYK